MDTPITKLKNILLLIVSITTLQSCYYDKVENLLGPNACDTNNVTYSNTISPMMNQYCTNCHSGSSASAGIDLVGYNNVKQYVDNGRLWGSMNHETSFSPMPKNAPKINECKLSQLKAWIDKGAVNN